MDVRDQIAVQAMMAIIAKSPVVTSDGFDSEHTKRFSGVARGAYAYADAMLDAREYRYEY